MLDHKIFKFGYSTLQLMKTSYLTSLLGNCISQSNFCTQDRAKTRFTLHMAVSVSKGKQVTHKEDCIKNASEVRLNKNILKIWSLSMNLM